MLFMGLQALYKTLGMLAEVCLVFYFVFLKALFCAIILLQLCIKLRC